MKNIEDTTLGCFISLNSKKFIENTQVFIIIKILLTIYFILYSTIMSLNI